MWARRGQTNEKQPKILFMKIWQVELGQEWLISYPFSRLWAWVRVQCHRCHRHWVRLQYQLEQKCQFNHIKIQDRKKKVTKKLNILVVVVPFAVLRLNDDESETQITKRLKSEKMTKSRRRNSTVIKTEDWHMKTLPLNSRIRWKSKFDRKNVEESNQKIEPKPTSYWNEEKRRMHRYFKKC